MHMLLSWNETGQVWKQKLGQGKYSTMYGSREKTQKNFGKSKKNKSMIPMYIDKLKKKVLSVSNIFDERSVNQQVQRGHCNSIPTINQYTNQSNKLFTVQCQRRVNMKQKTVTDRQSQVMNLKQSTPVSRHRRRSTVEKQPLVCEFVPCTPQPHWEGDMQAEQVKPCRQEIENVTEQFIVEWGKMVAHKQQLYKHLRRSMVREYPGLKREYRRISPENSAYSLSEKEHSRDSTSGAHDTLDRKSYFWSRTKRKPICTEAVDKITPLDHNNQSRQSVTFQKYITDRQFRKSFLIKNKKDRSITMGQIGDQNENQEQ